MVRWMTAFLDFPAATFDAGAHFWETVTGSSRSSTRGAHDEFATLLPPDGDAFLRVQRLDAGPARIHIDVHVGEDEVAAFAAHAIGLGARGGVAGSSIYRSPGGLEWCIVAHRGEAVRPGPFGLDNAGSSLVDQVAIDAPAPLFDAEVAFWAALLGLERRPAARPELVVLARAPGMPLRVLMQRLGTDDGGSTVRAHLDLACGPDVQSLADAHRSLGATVERVETHWTTLRDPAGLAYCLTARDPVTGLL